MRRITNDNRCLIKGLRTEKMDNKRVSEQEVDSVKY